MVIEKSGKNQHFCLAYEWESSVWVIFMISNTVTVTVEDILQYMKDFKTTFKKLFSFMFNPLSPKHDKGRVGNLNSPN